MSVSIMKLEEPRKQGIVSILGSESKTAATSLRRALSADMSSKKWLSQNGFSISPMKKIASSEEFSNLLEEYSVSSSEEGEKESVNNAGQFDIWSSIMSQNDVQDKSCSVPYIHPLVKRSGSGLSEKSLEVCTESLGSETGSDGFSDDPAPIHHHQQQHGFDHYDDHVRVGKYNFAPVGKKLPPPSFPPPLSSLASRRDGPSCLRMTHRRENGRLVVEAVSVTANNNFRAERENGRLVLTFLKETEEDLNDVVEEDSQEDENEEESQIVKEVDSLFDKAPKMIKLHRLALVMNPSWPHKFNDVIDSDDDVSQSLPVTVPAPAGSFNAYDYWWRAKPTTAQAMEKNSHNKHIISKNNSSKITNNYHNQRDLEVVKENKSDYIIPTDFNWCKVHGRSVFREPCYIATS